MEDEHGIVNVIVWRKVAEAQRWSPGSSRPRGAVLPGRRRRRNLSRIRDRIGPRPHRPAAAGSLLSRRRAVRDNLMERRRSTGPEAGDMRARPTSGPKALPTRAQRWSHGSRALL